MLYDYVVYWYYETGSQIGCLFCFAQPNSKEVHIKITKKGGGLSYIRA